MRRKVQKTLGFFLMSLGIISCFTLLNPTTEVLADTPAGIEFDQTGDSSTSPSSSSTEKPEPSVPSEPTIKKGGTLPMTGELLQPIMFLFIGWLLFALLVSVYFSKRNEKEGEN